MSKAGELHLAKHGKKVVGKGGLKVKMQDRNEDGYILPKTDIAKENRPCQKEINLLTIDFGGYVSFREAKTLMERFIFRGETRVKWVKKRVFGLMWRLLNQADRNHFKLSRPKRIRYCSK